MIVLLDAIEWEGKRWMRARYSPCMECARRVASRGMHGLPGGVRSFRQMLSYVNQQMTDRSWVSPNELVDAIRPE
jgi:hypothetical protein